MEIKWTVVLKGIATIHGSSISVVILVEPNHVSAVVCTAEKNIRNIRIFFQKFNCM